MKKLLKRSEIPENLKWNIKALYGSEEEYEKDVELMINMSKNFKMDFENKLNDEKTIIEAIKIYEKIQIL